MRIMVKSSDEVNEVYENIFIPKLAKELKCAEDVAKELLSKTDEDNTMFLNNGDEVWVVN